MKKFILLLAIFTIPIIITTAIFEIGLSKVTNSYNTKKDQLESQVNSIQLLILGNSQSLRGVNPDYFEGIKGYNLANVGQSIFYDTRITSKYLDKLPNLKYVLIGVSYVSMGYQIYNAAESWRDYYYSQFWGITYPELKWYDLKLYSKILLYTPDTALRYALSNFHVNLATGYCKNGWGYVDTNTIIHQFNENEIKLIAKNTSNLFNNTQILNQNCSDIGSLIEELKKRKITPILFTLPVYSVFSKYTSKKNFYFHLIEDICKTHKCIFLNYFDDPRFTREDYFDYLHLNFIGAKKISMIVNHDIFKENTSN